MRKGFNVPFKEVANPESIGNGAHKIVFVNRYTALHHAAQQGHINIVNILLEHKADANATTTVSLLSL